MTADPTPFDDLALEIRAWCRRRVPSAHVRAALLEHAAAPRAAHRDRSARRTRLATAAVAAAALLLGFFLWADVRGRSGSGDAHPEGVAPPGPIGAGEDAAVARERKANLALYGRERERLHREAKGKWVLIADRDPATVVGAFKPVVLGESPESLAELAPQAKHRFIFRIGDEGDRETAVAAWHAARYAGGGLAAALGMTWTRLPGGSGVDLRKGEAQATFGFSSQAPRILAGIEAPGSEGGAQESREILLGDDGPTLVLPPGDAERLSLARWEVPGTETIAGTPCRRVLVRVVISGIDVDATLVAAVASLPAVRLVQASRARNRFWESGGAGERALDLPWLGDARGNWIVYGNDRVLGLGPTVEAAVEAADQLRDVVHQRFALRWPREEPLELDAATFTVPTAVRLAGRELKGFTRPGDARVLLVDGEAEDVSAKVALPMAECGREVRLRGGGVSARAYAGYAWTGEAGPGVAKHLLLIVVRG